MADRLGSALFIGRSGAAVTLDLEYDEAEVIGRGTYVGLDDDPSIAYDVEVSVDRESLAAIESETGLTELQFPIVNHEFNYLDNPPLRISAYRTDPSRIVVTGAIAVLDDVLTFHAEEVGSPQIIAVIVVSVWALVCGASALRDLMKTCEDRAVTTCGVGGVASVKSKRAWRKLGCSADCEIKCK